MKKPEKDFIRNGLDYDKDRLKGLTIRVKTGEYVFISYVNPVVKKGDIISKGQPIGISQNMTKVYDKMYSHRSNSMTNHIHIDIKNMNILDYGYQGFISHATYDTGSASKNVAPSMQILEKENYQEIKKGYEGYKIWLTEFSHRDIKISSGYRDVVTNEAVQGVKSSNHLSGAAVDYHLYKDGKRVTVRNITDEYISRIERVSEKLRDNGVVEFYLESSGWGNLWIHEGYNPESKKNKKEYSKRAMCKHNTMWSTNGESISKQITILNKECRE